MIGECCVKLAQLLFTLPSVVQEVARASPCVVVDSGRKKMSRDFVCNKPGIEPATARGEPARKRFRHGSLLDSISRSSLPAGPQSLQELFNFPSHILEVCFQRDGFQQRFRKLLEHGVVEYSDYSGVFAERQAKAMLFQTLREDWNLDVVHTVLRMCDLDRQCQRVLLHASNTLDAGTACVFPDVRMQVTEASQEHLDACVPCKDLPTELRSRAYHEMRAWLLSNGHSAVDQDI